MKSPRCSPSRVQIIRVFAFGSHHAILISPKFPENLLPLVIMIHDGPHEISTTCYSTKINSFLGMNMAVLSINYRGSIGTGDKNLESIMGFISEVNL